MYTKKSLSFTILFFISLSCSASTLLSGPKLLHNSRQLLLVLSPTWNSFQGTLQLYQRPALNNRWRLVSKGPIPIVLGKNGMAWGPEVSQWYPLSATEQQKQEGDGRSPAGIYPLGTAFGFAPNARSIPHMNWPYLPLTNTSICVDDKKSSYYNQLIDSATMNNWDPNTSGEHMLEIVPQYTWGSVIRYNETNTVGNGSCIFMHVWKSPEAGTTGCVAMEQDELVHILSWLDPAKKPVIVVLPQAVYNDVQSQWGLPMLFPF